MPGTTKDGAASTSSWTLAEYSSLVTSRPSRLKLSISAWVAIASSSVTRYSTSWVAASTSLAPSRTMYGKARVAPIGPGKSAASSTGAGITPTSKSGGEAASVVVNQEPIGEMPTSPAMQLASWV